MRNSFSSAMSPSADAVEMAMTTLKVDTMKLVSIRIGSTIGSLASGSRPSMRAITGMA